VSNVAASIDKALLSSGCWSNDVAASGRTISFTDVMLCLYENRLDQVPELLVAIQNPNQLLSVVKKVGLFFPATEVKCRNCTLRKARFLIQRASRHAINYIRRKEAEGDLATVLENMRQCWNVRPEIGIMIPCREMDGSLRFISDR